MAYRNKTSTEKLDTRSLLAAIWQVMKLSYSISPSAILFKLASGILEATLPLLTAFLASQTITSITEAFNGVAGAKERALWFVVATAGVGLLMALKSSITSLVDQVVRFKIESRISDMLYDRFVRLDFWRYDDKDSIDLYEKAQDFTNFFTYVFDRVARLFTSLFGLVSAVVALGFITPWLSLLLAVAILPGLIVQYKISRFQTKHWRENITARRKQSFIEYNMMQPDKISELRLYNLANTMLNLRKQFRDKDQGARLEFEKSYIKWRVFSDALETIVQLGSLVWVVIKIANRQLPIGQFIYVQQMVGNALSSASMFISEYGSADEDLAKLKEYTDFMNLPLKIAGTKKLKAIKEVRFENVSFKYPKGETEVLKNVSFSMNEGDHIAIVGENGAGKTTLVKLLLGFYEPTSGEIYVNNVPLSEYNIASWHRTIGVLLQEFARYYFTDARENIIFGDIKANPTSSRISKALEEAEAHEIISDLPKGLKTPMATWYEEEGGTELSGGQWQRVALARNFYRQAPLMILDEPTSAIDALAEAKIFDRLFDKQNKKTLVAISHRLTTIENADKIYVFKNGQIVQEGTHRELSNQKDGDYVRMFRRQLKRKEA
ncbi:MAG TPA: ABC transporter ATP-binding protein [Candidatus Saccharibacteria bacterium]|jgi:ATP-binding cassette subfamily B protein|nr:ABC transporter ATP-binding protein [Candidatus Saccharibacteria bacterium]